MKVRIASILAALALTGASYAAYAQEYPHKPIRLVVPATASAPIDIISRWIIDGMSKDLGQPIFVDNKPGAQLRIGLQEMLRAPADGYTMIVVSMPLSLMPTIVSNYPIDLTKDVAPVGRTVNSYNVLVVHPAVPANTIVELVALLKANPGKRSFLSGGPGTPAHVVGELFKQETGVDALHVPYIQFAQGIGDLIGGRLDYGFITTAPMIPHVNAGKVRALAVTAPKRLDALAGVPTVAEAGFPSLQVSDWGAFLVKAGTPRALIDRLNASMRKVLAAPEAPAALAKFGAEPNSSSPDELRAFLDNEIARWGKVARTANIKVE